MKFFDFYLYGKNNLITKISAKLYFFWLLLINISLLYYIFNRAGDLSSNSIGNIILIIVAILFLFLFSFIFLQGLFRIKVIRSMIIDKEKKIVKLRIEKFNINCYSVSIPKNQFSFEVFKTGNLEIRKLNKTVGTISKNEIETNTNIKWLDLMRSIIEFKRDETKLPTTRV